jgi:hypothetical protein
MIRFFRWVLFLLGGLLLAVICLRWFQPPQPSSIYRVIRSDPAGKECCITYLISEERRSAVRTQVSGRQEIVFGSPYSPSGQWRFVNLTISNNQTIAFMLPVGEGDPVRLPSPVERGWYAHWSGEEDKLYFLLPQRLFGLSALYRITPQEPTPVRLTPYRFSSVSQIYEQKLPPTPFTPWMLLFYSLTFLLLAVLMGGRMRC